MKTNLRIFAVLLAVLLLLSMMLSCGQRGSGTQETGTGDGTTRTTDTGNSDVGDVAAEDIVVLYTNDVHCAIEENIGYAGLAAYKKLVASKTG